MCNFPQYRYLAKAKVTTERRPAKILGKVKFLRKLTKKL